MNAGGRLSRAIPVDETREIVWPVSEELGRPRFGVGQSVLSLSLPAGPGWSLTPPQNCTPDMVPWLTLEARTSRGEMPSIVGPASAEVMRGTTDVSCDGRCLAGRGCGGVGRRGTGWRSSGSRRWIPLVDARPAGTCSEAVPARGERERPGGFMPGFHPTTRSGPCSGRAPLAASAFFFLLKKKFFRTKIDIS